MSNKRLLQKSVLFMEGGNLMLQTSGAEFTEDGGVQCGNYQSIANLSSYLEKLLNKVIDERLALK